MQIKVLVVDDSRFYRNRLCEILSADPNIQVIGTAEHGGEAVDKSVNLKPDVVTMDVEMPVMDGISAVREIMKRRPVPILMLSSLTAEGAQATFDALDAGAVDFMLKRVENIAQKNREFADEICTKIRALGIRAGLVSRQFRNRGNPPQSAAETAGKEQSARPVPRDDVSSCKYKLVVIGASTGGPSAIQSIISLLPDNFPVPVLIVQHMPAAFTGSFARRLNALSKLSIKEAIDGDILGMGKVLIAPGGKQTVLEDNFGKKVVRIRDSKENEQYKPSIDISLKSVADIYGRNVLAVILTGMGADGREGASLLKKRGSSVWAQDEDTSVVYGMPQSVVEAGLADRVMPLSEIARQLAMGF
jgi:two-component system chemotaxis response regulator CheB